METLEHPNTRLSIDNPRGGVNVHFDMSSKTPLQQSPMWSVAGRQLRFFRLAPYQSLILPDTNNYVKVIVGRLENIDLSCLAAPFAVRSTHVADSKLVAGKSGALFAVMTLLDDAPVRLGDMSKLQFQGPHGEHLIWQSFEEKFSAYTDLFDGQDCHMASGLHILDEAGEEVVYVNFWTCGKGVDLSTHNHGGAPSPMSPAFVEVHWVLAAGTDSGGMYETPEPGAAHRTRHSMQTGEEHGPFYDRDTAGMPMFRDNGAVQYPWHGWQGGTDKVPGQSYDFVAAFEINPDYIEASVG